MEKLSALPFKRAGCWALVLTAEGLLERGTEDNFVRLAPLLLFRFEPTRAMEDTVDWKRVAGLDG